MSSNVRSVFSRWLTSLGTISVNAVMQAIGLLIFARKLGPSEYAVIVAATAVAALATEFVGFGAGDLLVREVSRDPEAHRSAFGRAVRLVTISYLPITILASIVAVLWFRPAAVYWVVIVLVGSEIANGRILFMTEQVAIAHHQTHRANLMQKLALRNTAEIVLYAVRKGVIA